MVVNLEIHGSSLGGVEAKTFDPRSIHPVVQRKLLENAQGCTK